MIDKDIEPYNNIEDFELEEENEKKKKSKLKLLRNIAIISVFIIIIIIIVFLVLKKINDNPTPENEIEKYRQEIKNKIRPAYTLKPASDNSTFILVQGSYIQMNKEFLESINKLRKEACEEGIINPITLQPLKIEDYIPLQWSTDLERISRIRASESSIKFSKNIRPNGEDIYEITINNIFSSKELQGNLKTNNSKEMIENLLTEKKLYKKDSSTKMADEYKTIITNTYKFIGLTYFKANIDTEYYTMILELSNLTSLNENKFLDGDKDIYQTVDIWNTEIGKYKIEGKNLMDKGEIQYLIPKLEINSIFSEFYKIYVWPYNFHYYEFISDNKDAVSVNVIGKAEGIKSGVANITLSNEKKIIIANITIAVKCNHTFIYTYNKDSKNKTIGIKRCTKCGYFAKFIPPNKLDIWWSNNVTTPEEYSFNVPESNPIGSSILGMMTADGDEEYRDILFKVSEEGFIDNIVISKTDFSFDVIKKGNVNVTFYPKYNINYTQEFMLVLGN